MSDRIMPRWVEVVFALIVIGVVLRGFYGLYRMHALFAFAALVVGLVLLLVGMVVLGLRNEYALRRSKRGSDDR